MNPYLFTISFLAIISMLTSSEMHRSHQSVFEQHCYQAAGTTLAAAEELRNLNQVADLRSIHAAKEKKEEEFQDKIPNTVMERSSQPKVRALGIDALRPPDNSRINFYIMLHHERKKNCPKEFSLYEVTAQLMRNLYQDAPFCQGIPNFEYRILDRLFEKKDASQEFIYPDELATLDLEDSTLQQILFHMLKGSSEIPSLLNYITFDTLKKNTKEQARKINLMFADSKILEAIFPNPQISGRLIEKRDTIWEQIAYQEAHKKFIPPEIYKNRSKWSDVIEEALKQVLTEAGLNFEKYKQQVFDCTLGSRGSILFVENPNTHIITREKFTPANLKLGN